MTKESLTLMSMGKRQLLFLTLLSEIVDMAYANSKYIEKCSMIYRSFVLLTVWS